MTDKQWPRDEDALERQARELPESIEPSRDLWPAIEARLERGVAGEQFGPRRWANLIGVGIAAAAVAAVAVFVALDRIPVAEDGATAAPRSHLGPEFLAARTAMVSDLEAPLSRLPPKARAIIVANLSGVQQSRSALDAALRSQPNDLLLQELMLSSSTEELRLLRELNLLTNTVVERMQL